MLRALLSIIVVASTEPQEPLGARLDELAASAVANGSLVSLSVAIARDDGPLLIRAYGKSSLELNVPASEHHRYRIASVAKEFTAASIWLLADEGKLRLTDPVGKYIPLPKEQQSIT